MPFKSNATDLGKRCLYCQKHYVVQCKSRFERSKYCSRSCRQKNRFQVEQWDMGKVKKPAGIVDNYKERLCDFCNQTYRPTSGKQRWCCVCVPDKKARAFMQRYSLSKANYDLMFVSQDGKCGLCDEKASVIDHDHETGKIRMALCYGCNQALSRFETSGWALRAAEYVKRYKEL